MRPGRERQSRPPSSRILDRVGERKGVDPLTLPPLYDAVDTSALDALSAHGFDGTLTFRYAGLSVTVHGDGRIRLSEGAINE